jgi:hypothetical protein
MSVTNQNQEIDSFKIVKNANGTFLMEWDKEDPNWKFLNELTSQEIQVMMEQAIKEELQNRD